MNNFYKILSVITSLILLSSSVLAAVDTKIKFDGQTYNLSNPETKTEKFVYLLKDENIGNWHTQISSEFINNSQNPTEAAAEFAYQIQKENPQAVVLLYPEAATLGYITFPTDKKFYVYNCMVFKSENNGVKKLGYSKRFYASSNGGENGARTAAILFAEKNNKKYMEMINKFAKK